MKKALKITLIILGLLCAAFIVVALVLFLPKNQATAKLISPTNNYSIQATVDVKRSDENYGIVMIHLYDAQGKPLTTFSSHASHFQKWAIGWDTQEDIIILQSSDIGDKAWRVVDGIPQPVTITNNLSEQAKDLYQEKYKPMTQYSSKYFLVQFPETYNAKEDGDMLVVSSTTGKIIIGGFRPSDGHPDPEEKDFPFRIIGYSTDKESGGVPAAFYFNYGDTRTEQELWTILKSVKNLP